MNKESEPAASERCEESPARFVTSEEADRTSANSGGTCPKCGGSIPTCCRCPLPAPELTMGYAHIRDTSGSISAVTFACAECKRKLIWSFTNDWKCPCGNSTFRIDNAVQVPATGATSEHREAKGMTIEDAARVVYRKYGANLAAFWRDAFAAEAQKHGEPLDTHGLDGNCIHYVPICHRCRITTIELHLKEKDEIRTTTGAAGGEQRENVCWWTRRAEPGTGYAQSCGKETGFSSGVKTCDGCGRRIVYAAPPAATAEGHRCANCAESIIRSGDKWQHEYDYRPECLDAVPAPTAATADAGAQDDRCKCGLGKDDPIHSFTTEWQQMHRFMPSTTAAPPVETAQDDGWVTFGRIKVDIENETETFERIHPPQSSTTTPGDAAREAAQEIDRLIHLPRGRDSYKDEVTAIISKHFSPTAPAPATLSGFAAGVRLRDREANMTSEQYDAFRAGMLRAAEMARDEFKRAPEAAKGEDCVWMGGYESACDHLSVVIAQAAVIDSVPIGERRPDWKYHISLLLPEETPDETVRGIYCVVEQLLREVAPAPAGVEAVDVFAIRDALPRLVSGHAWCDKHIEQVGDGFKWHVPRNICAACWIESVMAHCATPTPAESGEVERLRSELDDALRRVAKFNDLNQTNCEQLGAARAELKATKEQMRLVIRDSKEFAEKCYVEQSRLQSELAQARRQSYR